MREGRAKAILLVVFGWVVIVLLLAAAYRYFVRPASAERLADETGSESRYRHHVVVAADSFSGYAVLRSDTMAEELRRKGIKLTVRDDGADYAARIEALRDRRVNLAVFTIDSFLAAGAESGDYPATIVMIIDETKGADAMIAYKDGVAQITDLDHPEARIVLTPGSPSEFLARTVIAHFNLPRLSSNWLLPANGAGDVLSDFRNADRSSKRAYVLWEPYVSRALEEPGSIVLLDSSKLKGYIVDVLVAERGFLKDHPEQVRAFVEAYLRTAYAQAHIDDGMVKLVREDAIKTGSDRLTEEQVRRLTAGIQWKNTLENYAHFGLLPADRMGDLLHLEDMITNVAEVLVQTGATSSDPVGGKAHMLFYDRILAEMKEASFHPAKKLAVISDSDADVQELGQIRSESILPTLSEEQWNQLVAVGELRVRPISFARGTARINVQSERELQTLAKRLQAWPRYYLTVMGHARSDGDAGANRRLAEERAQAAINILREAGVSPQRMRIKAVPLSGRGGAAQSVSFVVEQLPY